MTACLPGSPARQAGERCWQRVSRPEWDKLLTVLRKDDVLMTTKLDRIGRSLVNVVDLVNLLGERGVQLVVLDQGIDTTTPGGRFIFHLFAALA